MKPCLPILLAALPAILLLSTESTAGREICPQENCLTNEKCEEEVVGGKTCYAQGTTCCSIVKSEYQTHCNHFQGVCMDGCSTQLQRNAVDCPQSQVCCVLV